MDSSLETATSGHQQGRRPSRALALLVTGETTSALGTSVASIALPMVAVTTLGAGPLAMGLLEAAVWLPWLLVGLPAGAWVDRWPRRAVMIVCDVAAALAFAAVTFAAMADVLTIPLLMVIALVAGTSAVFFGTAYRSYVPSIVAAPELQRANGLLQGGESAAGVVGPGLGGVLLQAVGAVAGLALNAASFLVSALCLVRIPPGAPVPRRRERPGLLWEIGAGVRAVIGDPYLRGLAGYGAMVNAAQTGMGALQILFLTREAGASPLAVGVLLAVEGTGGVVGAWLSSVAVRRLGNARTLLVCALGLFPFALLMPLAGPGPGLWLFAVAAVVSTAAVVAFSIVGTTFRQTYVPAQLLGRVTACTRVVAYAAAPAGAVLAGVLAGALGLRAGLAVVLGLGAAAGLVLLVGPFPKSRDLPDAMAGG